MKYFFRLQVERGQRPDSLQARVKCNGELLIVYISFSVCNSHKSIYNFAGFTKGLSSFVPVSDCNALELPRRELYPHCSSHNFVSVGCIQNIRFLEFTFVMMKLHAFEPRRLIHIVSKLRKG